MDSTPVWKAGRRVKKAQHQQIAQFSDRFLKWPDKCVKYSIFRINTFVSSPGGRWSHGPWCGESGSVYESFTLHRHVHSGPYSSSNTIQPAGTEHSPLWCSSVVCHVSWYPTTFLLCEQVYESSEPLRIGYYENDGYFQPSPSMSRALRETKELLEKAGHTVSVLQPRVCHFGDRSCRESKHRIYEKSDLRIQSKTLITDNNIMQGELK